MIPVGDEAILAGRLRSSTARPDRARASPFPRARRLPGSVHPGEPRLGPPQLPVLDLSCALASATAPKKRRIRSSEAAAA